MKNSEIKNEIGKLSSILPSPDEHNKIDVPDGYFENMQEKVLAKLKKEAPVEHKPISFWKKRKYSLLSMAAVLLLVIASYFVFSSIRNENTDILTNTAKQAFAYLDDNLEEISMYDLIENLDEEDIEYFSDISEEELELYFDNNIDELNEEDIEIYL